MSLAHLYCRPGGLTSPCAVDRTVSRMTARSVTTRPIGLLAFLLSCCTVIADVPMLEVIGDDPTALATSHRSQSRSLKDKLWWNIVYRIWGQRSYAESSVLSMLGRMGGQGGV